MSNIVRPAREKRKTPVRPAWLYPEGTLLTKGERTFEVVRDYGSEDFSQEIGDVSVAKLRTTRTGRFWSEVLNYG